MIHRFARYELDEDGRSLRLDGGEVVLQPLIFNLLAHLLRNRHRVVGKDELSDALWPGVIVTEASLQRAVSLARSALRSGGGATLIRTYPRQGYRFCDDHPSAPVWRCMTRPRPPSLPVASAPGSAGWSIAV